MCYNQRVNADPEASGPVTRKVVIGCKLLIDSIIFKDSVLI